MNAEESNANASKAAVSSRADQRCGCLTNNALLFRHDAAVHRALCKMRQNETLMLQPVFGHRVEYYIGAIRSELILSPILKRLRQKGGLHTP